MGNRAAQDRKRVADRIKMAGFNDLFGSMEKPTAYRRYSLVSCTLSKTTLLR